MHSEIVDLEDRKRHAMDWWVLLVLEVDPVRLEPITQLVGSILCQFMTTSLNSTMVRECLRQTVFITERELQVLVPVNIIVTRGFPFFNKDVHHLLG
jgi:hypothetical protein